MSAPIGRGRRGPPLGDFFADTVWLVLFFVFACCAVAQSGCVRSVTVCTQYDRRLGADANGWQRDGASTSVCAEVVPPEGRH